MARPPEHNPVEESPDSPIGARVLDSLPENQAPKLKFGDESFGNAFREWTGIVVSLVIGIIGTAIAIWAAEEARLSRIEARQALAATLQESKRASGIARLSTVTIKNIELIVPKGAVWSRDAAPKESFEILVTLKAGGSRPAENLQMVGHADFPVVGGTCCPYSPPTMILVKSATLPPDQELRVKMRVREEYLGADTKKPVTRWPVMEIRGGITYTDGEGNRDGYGFCYFGYYKKEVVPCSDTRISRGPKDP